MKKQAAHHPRQRQCSSNTGHDPDASQCHSLAYDQTDDVTRLRSQRHAQANITGVLAYQVGEHAKNTNCRKRQGEEGENSQQGAGKARSRQCTLKDILHGLYVIDRRRWFDSMNLAHH